jgi:hypothetical protein
MMSLDLTYVSASQNRHPARSGTGALFLDQSRNSARGRRRAAGARWQPIRRSLGLAIGPTDRSSGAPSTESTVLRPNGRHLPASPKEAVRWTVALGRGFGPWVMPAGRGLATTRASRKGTRDRPI